MSRLVDYFCVIGFDQEKQRGRFSSGKVIQRFPAKDWPDVPFIEGIELFCQPQGWCLSRHQQQPTFFTSVLTDIQANRHYCSCLKFQEMVSVDPPKHADDEDMYLEGIEMLDDQFEYSDEVTNMFAPKCLVIVSRHPFIEHFRNFLGVIYKTFLSGSPNQLEPMIATLVGSIQVPQSPGADFTFNLDGIEERLQTPLSTEVPLTGTCVYRMFSDLGIHTSVMLFSAVMTEQKILFHSKSYNRLFDSCQALAALLYPFKYSHIFIPLLPASLLEVLSTPTPFVIGVHSGLKKEVCDLLDVIVVDLDGGCITVPDCVHIPRMDEATDSELQCLLRHVLSPELFQADDAFPSDILKPSPPENLDKEIRAIFVRLFAQLLNGYRSCLQTVRINPKPFITFHKAAFLGQRNLVENEFVVRLLDCMFFNSFVQERGIPYRTCDLFDDICSSNPGRLKEDAPQSTLDYIKRLAKKLYDNENPHNLPPIKKVKLTPEEINKCDTFPLLNATIIADAIESQLIQREMIPEHEQLVAQVEKVVPLVAPTSSSDTSSLMLSNSARRLEVMKNCVNYIFENRISDARKTFPAVLRALKNNSARLALAQELSIYVTGNKSQLSHEQFDLVVRLMNCALQQDCDAVEGTAAGASGYGDVNGVAAAIMPLAMSFCRKLCTHVIQFAYTCLQGHPIWNNLSFWEATFYKDVEKDLKRLYVAQYDDSVSSLQVAADQMRKIKMGKYTPQEIEELSKNEEKTLFSQAVHFANRIVALKIPLDVTNQERVRGSLNNINANINEVHSDSNSYVTGAMGSVRDEREDNEESGFEEDRSGSHGKGLHVTGQISADAIKFTSRFLDKVCNEAELGDDYVKNLHQNVPMVVAMQVETLEGVFRESRKLPPVSKPKIVTPHLLPGEDVIISGIRVFLMPDGRDEICGSGFQGNGTNQNAGLIPGPILLPAEGAVFLTNYRLIFRGRPVDPFYAELPVTRSFPISTLIKEKRISLPSNYLVAAIDHYIQEGLQLRSNTFQLMKIAFDEEVTSETIENFRKTVNRARAPADIFALFAFTSKLGPASHLDLFKMKPKDKHSTFRGLTKKTLARAGIHYKGNKSKTNKYSVPGSPSKMSTASGVSPSISESSVMSSSTLATPTHTIAVPSPSASFRDKDPKTLQKLVDLLYLKDFYRLGLGSKRDVTQVRRDVSSRSLTSEVHFRISVVNSSYSIIRTYPTFLVVPNSISDESIKKLSRGYRSNRLPAIVWKHPIKRGLLLRSSTFQGKGMTAMFRGQGPGSHANTTGDAMEMEKYFRAIINLTPSHFLRKSTRTELRSLEHKSPLVGQNSNDSSNSNSPKKSMANTLYKQAFNTLHRGAQGRSSISNKSRDVASELSSPGHDRPATLHILGEKSLKGIKTDNFSACSFIPLELHDVKHVKASFVKLLRACCPSSLTTDPDQSFYKNIKSSDWFTQIQNILQVSSMVVDLIDTQGSSVIVSLDDGSDLVPQITSLAQLCLDPYYRTFEGFLTLIEKEWLSFGHRFTHRTNQTAEALTSGFAPIFLQFLDMVHQLMNQFPLSFEFNHYYLKTVAFHHVSCRFRTFLCDCECERSELGWLVEDVASKIQEEEEDDLPDLDETIEPTLTSPSAMKTLTASSNGTSSNLGISFFDYSRRIWSKTSVFYNFLYVPVSRHDTDYPVLKPSYSFAKLVIWDYFCQENLSNGSCYDIELIQMEKQRREEQEATDHASGRKSSRIICNEAYDTVVHDQPSEISQLLENIRHVESLLGQSSSKWSNIWSKIEIPFQSMTSLSSSAQLNSTNSLVSLGCVPAHLLHGMKPAHGSNSNITLTRTLTQDAGSNSFVYSHRPHRFEKYAFSKPSNCDHCKNVLWGLVKTGMKCSACGYNCHDRCESLVGKNCQGYRPPAALETPSPFGMSVTREFGQTPRSPSRNDISGHHQGLLQKRGALLKSWKQRWFILDSVQHQLRYYDSAEDRDCKGFIDLSEVASIATHASDATQFDLRTTKRSYQFMACDPREAQEWVEKIQACLQ